MMHINYWTMDLIEWKMIKRGDLMEYNCVDLGSDKCPCVLMEAGQCYSCNMIKKGKCDCNGLWQGVCPYTEYMLKNKKIVRPVAERKYVISRIKSFSPNLSVLTLETPLGFGLKCKEMGTFLMIKWQNWFVPISVMRVLEDFENQNSYVDIAVSATGPKTIGVLKNAMVGQEMIVKGPFFSGLINRDIYNKNSNAIIIAKGIAIMPLINIKERLTGKIKGFKLDKSKLPTEFLNEYLVDLDYSTVDLEKDSFEVAEELKEIYGYSYKDNNKPNLFMMVSPYYEEKLLKLTGFGKGMIIAPNHSNMCCGEGYCGSCSWMNRDGVTVRRCKCIDG